MYPKFSGKILCLGVKENTSNKRIFSLWADIKYTWARRSDFLRHFCARAEIHDFGQIRISPANADVLTRNHFVWKGYYFLFFINSWRHGGNTGDPWGGQCPAASLPLWLSVLTGFLGKKEPFPKGACNQKGVLGRVGDKTDQQNQTKT